MDGSRFDDLSRLLARGLPRRRILTGIAGAALAALGAGRAGAQTCRTVDSICREHANCCTRICGAKDSTGRRRCVCPSSEVACGDRCVDPATAYQSDPQNCGSCGNACASIDSCLNGACVCVDDGTACAGRTCGSAVNNCGATVACGTACSGNGCCDGLRCIGNSTGAIAITCPEGCLGCSGAGPIVQPECGLDGKCCEGNVLPGSFCSETIPCCQIQAGVQRGCQNGRCCILDGFSCNSGLVCCSGNCQSGVCVAA